MDHSIRVVGILIEWKGSQSPARLQPWRKLVITEKNPGIVPRSLTDSNGAFRVILDDDKGRGG
jgi:hypothetical protein